MAEEKESYVEKIDSNMKKYYRSKDTPYDKLFVTWCDESGFGEVEINDDFEGDIDDSTMADPDDGFADGNFPFPKQRWEKTAQTIMRILQECREDKPNFAIFADNLPQFTKEDFDSITEDDIREIINLYSNQCPAMWDAKWDGDLTLLAILALGRKKGIDYLQNLRDMFDRDRITFYKENSNKRLKCTDWIHQKKNLHIKELSNMSVSIFYKPDPNKDKMEKKPKQKAHELVQGAVTCYGTRCYKLLQLCQGTSQINDSLEDILSYIEAAITFIQNLIQVNKGSCPFQFDMCIVYGKPDINDGVNDNESDDDDDDDEEDIKEDKERDDNSSNLEYVDFIGKIEEKLDKNKLKNCKIKRGEKKNISRDFDSLLKQMADDNDSKEEEWKYIHNKRLISMIDRRASNDDNKEDIDDYIYMFEPPINKVINSRDIPSDNVSEWGISASRACILPSIPIQKIFRITRKQMDKIENDGKIWTNIKKDLEEYGNDISIDKQISAIKVTLKWGYSTQDIVNVIQKYLGLLDDYKDDEKNNVHANITTVHPKPGQITFSFQVKSSEQIKCYIYHCGQMIRLFPSEIKEIFPIFFKMDRDDNKKYFEGEHFKGTIKSIEPKFIDKQFNSFAVFCQ